MGLLASLAVIATLGDPGITSDEPLDVRVGRTYLDQANRWIRLYAHPLSLSAPRRVDADRLFRDNAQHPPLGRLAVGLASVLFEPLEDLLGGADPFSVHPARVAPALAFGLLVGLLTSVGVSRFGPLAGLGAGLSALLMPRLFAHAHFATLDTLLVLAWVASLLAAERATTRPHPARAMAGAGFLWGLALLVKIHAWVQAPIVLALVVWRLGPRRAAAPMALWSAVGLLVFLAGWPWLWFDTLHRLQAFLGTSVVRLPLRVQYFGHVYLDHDVPWHYPWVYFVATVPVGLHLLGGLGAWGAWAGRKTEPLPLLILATIALWLGIFSTRAPVYDGERLFLLVFPLWALLIGRGVSRAWKAARRPAFRVVLGAFLIAQAYGVVTIHPFGLSYFSAVVGGLPGAEKLGLELTYWGDAIDTPLLNVLARRARAGQTAAIAPTLHHAQATAYLTAPLRTTGVELLDESAIESAQWLVVYRRTAYWPPRLEAELARCRPVLLQKRQGVWLAGLWLRPGVRFAQNPFPNSETQSPNASKSPGVAVESSRTIHTILSE
jgi:4-amino-4-deoxy-L-arabinose transferase-like glycosyltransferase